MADAQSTTQRASARPTFENRRAVLRSILAAGAIGATPIAAGTAIAAELASAAPGPDAELVNLIGVTREAKASRVAATVEMEEAARRVPGVPAPNALIATDTDARLWPSVKVGERIPDEILSRDRALRAQHLIRRDAAREAQADKLIAAHNEWHDAGHEAKVGSGAWAAMERQEARLLGVL